MSKLESDKIMLTEEAFKINELLESLFVMVQPAFEAKKAKVSDTCHQDKTRMPYR